MTQKIQRKVKNKNKATTASSKERVFETDGTYFLKLVVFALLGTLWIKFQQPISWFGLPFNAVPVGFLVGLLLVRKFEQYQTDRKIWYAILLVVTIVCYFAPAGIVI